MPDGIIDLRSRKPPPPQEPLPQTEFAAHETPLLAWEALESERPEAAGPILLLTGVLLAVGGIVAFFFQNFLFGVFLLVAGGLVASYAFRAPQALHVAITARGVKIGPRLYEFGSLESFWIFYDPPLVKELALTSKKTFVPRLRLPLGDVDPVELREVLKRFLPEREQEESLIDIIAKRLGF